MYPFNPNPAPEYTFSQEYVGLPSDIPNGGETTVDENDEVSYPSCSTEPGEY